MSDWILDMKLRLAGDPVQMREPLLVAAGDPMTLLEGWEDMSAAVVAQSKCGIDFLLVQNAAPPVAIGHAARIAREYPTIKVCLFWLSRERQEVGRVVFRQGQQQLNEHFAATRKFRRMAKAWFKCQISAPTA
jgi:hypothetical protein